jgi:ferric-dicitrate binding protein FerR (iron transport regulator)
MNRDWHDLIQRQMAGLLSEDESLRFQGLLKAEPALRRLYLHYMNLDVALSSHARAIEPSDSQPIPIHKIQSSAPPKRPTWFSMAVAACALLAFTWGWFGLYKGKEWATVLSVEGGVEIVHAQGSRLAAAGETLRAGDSIRVLEEGRANLSVNGLGSVALGPEANVRLSQQARVLELGSGFIEIEARKQPRNRPWRIRTPEAEAAVIGTKFSLSASDRRTALRVSEGLVHLTGLASGQMASVPGGNRALVAAAAPPEVEKSRTGSVLLLTSRVPLNAQWDRFNRLISDQLVRTRLWRLGFQVETRHFDDIQPEALKDRALVIVSIFPEGVGEPALERLGLAQTPLPVLCLEPAGYHALGLVDTQDPGAFGFASGARPVAFHPQHPHRLLQKLTASPERWFKKIEGWGRPAPSASVLASIQDQPDHVVWFAYEAGSPLARSGSQAPARRVGLFLDPYNMTDHSNPIWEMFEASVDWSVSTEANR